jgi:hypothetical protein
MNIYRCTIASSTPIEDRQGYYIEAETPTEAKHKLIRHLAEVSNRNLGINQLTADLWS